MLNVTREGRIRFELMGGERLNCGECGRTIHGISEPMPDQSDIAFITTDGMESQDFVVLCYTCLESLAGPEFEGQEGETK